LPEGDAPVIAWNVESASPFNETRVRAFTSSGPVPDGVDIVARDAITIDTVTKVLDQAAGFLEQVRNDPGSYCASSLAGEIGVQIGSGAAMARFFVDVGLIRVGTDKYRKLYAVAAQK
jgi:hypothetical protein